MLGIIVCTHSNFAKGAQAAVEMIAGQQEDFTVIGFQEGEEMQELSNKILELAKKYEEKKEPYVVLVDLFGATPFNASAAALATFNTSVISGVNLPLLLELVMGRSYYEDYDRLLENALQGAKDNIRIIKMKEMFQ